MEGQLLNDIDKPAVTGGSAPSTEYFFACDTCYLVCSLLSYIGPELLDAPFGLPNTPLRFRKKHAWFALRCSSTDDHLGLAVMKMTFGLTNFQHVRIQTSHGLPVTPGPIRKRSLKGAM